MNALVIPPGTQQGNWIWDGTQWVCGPGDVPPFPGCPPPGFPPAGCPPWFPSANSPPWYPGANAGVTFSLTAPVNPVRGHFWWDGNILWLFDGAMWADTQGTGSTAVDAPKDGNAYGRVNGAWARVVNVAGDIMTGLLQLSGDPTTALQAVTKQYSDANRGIRKITPQFYNASGTITIPANATQGFVQMWGATGGSGGIAGGSSGGTGAGGYLEKLLTGLTAGNTLIYTQGAAGIAGSSSTGGNGGVTTLVSGTQIIGTLTCNGSNGSAAATTEPISGTAGATATGGDVNVTGQMGQPYSASGLTGGVPGGNNFLSLGANGAYNSATGNQGNPGGLKITWYA